VIHFAAESHVDRSIAGPKDFILTNVVGTFNLLELCRIRWPPGHGLFHHVGTDEVYGSLGATGAFTEQSRYDPSSPYSASKAAADHLVRAYHRTYGLAVKLTQASNNYGPLQFPEKLIPLTIANALRGERLPVYGAGEQVRDWLHVDDHADAIWTVVSRGRVGHTYNVGGGAERRNIDVVRAICRALAVETGRPPRAYEDLITFVKDRPGHDQRYAIDATKLRTECAWAPRETFETWLAKTVGWYVRNRGWLDRARAAEPAPEGRRAAHAR